MDQDPQQCVRDLLEQVRAARDAGFASVWVSQHYLAKPYQMVQTWPMAARVAAEAGDMSVGTSIFLLTLHNPVYAAEQVATLDVLTGGRFIFGIGLGYRVEEFEAFGVEQRTKVSRFTEALDVTIRLLTTDQPITHVGRHFKLTAASLPLKPVQRPHPPIWIAGSNDPAVKRAGGYGFPWLINPHAGLSTLERQMQLYHESLAAAGHPLPADLPIFKELCIARTHEAAVAAARPFLQGKYDSYARWGLDKPMPKDESLAVPFEELARDRFIMGDPDECAEEIARYNAVLGVNHFLLRLQWPGMPQARILEQIELIGAHVIPRFH